MSNYHPDFKEAAYQEMAQGQYKDNESMLFTAIPDYLMANSLWAWDAGWKACLKSLTLTPERLRELERQYHEALAPRKPR